MFQETITIDDREVIVDYFPFKIPEESEKKPDENETYQAFLIAQLSYFASLLKAPPYYALDLYNRNHLDWKYSRINPILGLLGAVTSVPLFAFGSMIKQTYLSLKGKQIEHYRSTKFQPPIVDKNKPLGYGTRNIAMLPTFLCNDSRLDEAKNRLPFIIKALRDAADKVDIICLQEAFLFQEEIIAGLEDLYGDFLYNIAPDSLLLPNSGLMVISKYHIKQGYYYRMPLPLVTPVDEENEYSHVLLDGVCNKGVVMVYLENENIVMGGHFISNASKNQKKQDIIEKHRFDAMTITIRKGHAFAEELRKNGEHPNKIIFCGDTNSTNEEEDGQVTLQRAKNNFFFSHFPNPPQHTWHGGYQQYHSHHKRKVTFDHLGEHSLEPLNKPNDISDDEKVITIAQDPYYAKGPISDHKYFYIHYQKRQSTQAKALESSNSSPASKPLAEPLKLNIFSL